MRRAVIVAAAVCLALVGAVGPIGVIAPTAAATPPKVVIIVGPVGSVTDAYRSDADAAAIEALRFTPNVVKVYTPTATWAAAKAALQDASIVIYMGHGTGWPSPYPPFRPALMDGLGLNPTAGTDNTTTKYWGESYLASDVRLAPNAVVILAHLCYSAGNSEPGNPDPTFAVAQERVDNMAAGWLAAGARAVIAEVYGEGLYGGAAWYVDQLFGQPQTIDAVWRSNPTFNNHVVTFPSVRSPGFTAEMDPGGVQAPPYHRSIVGDLSLTTSAVVGSGGMPPTQPVSPPAPAVPPTLTIPLPPLVAGDAPIEFSPNGDHVADTVGIPYVLSATGSIDVTIRDASGVAVRSFTEPSGAGAGKIVWDGLSDGGSVVTDGRYAVTLTPRTTEGLVGAGTSVDVVSFASLGRVGASPRIFFPQDGDRYASTTRFTFQVSRPLVVTATLTGPGGTVVATPYVARPVGPGTYAWTWNGRLANGGWAPRGRYVLTVSATDGVVTGVERTSVLADAFSIAVSRAAVRGSLVTITATTAEPLAVAARLTIRQPGVIARVVTMARLSASVYRVTIRLAATGSAGTVSFTVTGRDLAGRINGTTVTRPLG